jgi:hypothetical protein
MVRRPKAVSNHAARASRRKQARRAVATSFETRFALLRMTGKLERWEGCVRDDDITDRRVNADDGLIVPGWKLRANALEFAAFAPAAVGSLDRCPARQEESP